MTMGGKEATTADLQENPSKKKRKNRDGPYGKTSLGLQERWDEMFGRLVAFKRQHGHCLVPNRYVDDPSLGAWVSTQRRQYKILTSGSSESTPMTPDRAARLVSIGFVWSTRDPRHVPWETRFRELSDYKKKYGDCLVPIGYKENVQLSNWVSTQRHEYRLYKDNKPSRMTPGRVQALETIGFVWDPPRGAPQKPITNQMFSEHNALQSMSSSLQHQESIAQSSDFNMMPQTPSSDSMGSKIPTFPVGMQLNTQALMNMNRLELMAMNAGMNTKDSSAAAQMGYGGESRIDDEQAVLNAMRQQLLRHQQMAKEQQEIALQQEQLMMQAIRKKEQALHQPSEQDYEPQSSVASARDLLSQLSGNNTPQYFGGVSGDSSMMLNNMGSQHHQNALQQPQHQQMISPSPSPFPAQINALSALAHSSIPQKVEAHPGAMDQKAPVSEESPMKKSRLFDEVFGNDKLHSMSPEMLSQAKLLGLVPHDEEDEDESGEEDDESIEDLDDEITPKLGVDISQPL